MLNEPDFFWKNWRLGTELQISGSHIYNALYFLDKLEYLIHEEDIFEFLYNTSLGIERIQKIAIILLEHNENVDQEAFEKELITHNHVELAKRVKSSKSLNFGKVHNKFLQLISKFYNSYRYRRFNKSSVYHRDYDKYDFLEFVAAELNLEIDQRYKCLENSKQVKKFLGKCISKIACEFYEIIRNRAYEIGTFTYEIRYHSKAFKIFTAKQYTFDNENNLKREIIISLLNKNGFSDEFTDYIKNLTPLNFEGYNSSHYIKYLFNNLESVGILEEYEYFAYEKLIPKKRDEEIEGIGESHYLSNELDDWLGEE
ncbi:hypothetical protein [Flagellimonas sp.]|uniref:hypothetical protein n=1 Tax=Flagellimonas sp. TaxID=2058762 RepID=UPI003AB66D5B